jgi:hypothetical protein
MFGSRLRRFCDGFLRIVTPRRRDLGDARHAFDVFTGGLLVRPLRDAWPGTEPGAGWFGSISMDDARRLGYWPGQERRPDFVRAWQECEETDALERPWNYRWDRLPKRSAGPGFSREDYHAARERGREVARETLGEDLWQRLERDGYLDVPSRKFAGLTYRLRVGRRIQVIGTPGAETPWFYEFLCINPAYPLPEHEFFAQLYLYVRDDEEEIVRVAAPQPWDQRLGRTF